MRCTLVAVLASAAACTPIAPPPVVAPQAQQPPTPTPTQTLPLVAAVRGTGTPAPAPSTATPPPSPTATAAAAAQAPPAGGCAIAGQLWNQRHRGYGAGIAVSVWAHPAFDSEILLGSTTTDAEGGFTVTVPERQIAFDQGTVVKFDMKALPEAIGPYDISDGSGMPALLPACHGGISITGFYFGALDPSLLATTTPTPTPSAATSVRPAPTPSAPQTVQTTPLPAAASPAAPPCAKGPAVPSLTGHSNYVMYGPYPVAGAKVRLQTRPSVGSPVVYGEDVTDARGHFVVTGAPTTEELAISILPPPPFIGGGGYLRWFVALCVDRITTEQTAWTGASDGRLHIGTRIDNLRIGSVPLTTLNQYGIPYPIDPHISKRGVQVISWDPVPRAAVYCVRLQVQVPGLPRWNSSGDLLPGGGCEFNSQFPPGPTPGPRLFTFISSASLSTPDLLPNTTYLVTVQALAGIPTGSASDDVLSLASTDVCAFITPP